MAKATRAKSAQNKSKSSKEPKRPAPKAAPKVDKDVKGKASVAAVPLRERVPGESRIAGKIGGTREFLRDVRSEVKKVNWPSRKQLLASTAAVLFAILVLGLYIGGLDWMFRGMAKYFNL